MVSSYKVIIQPGAQLDLAEIRLYIATIIKSPLAAINLEMKLVESILSLKNYPYRTPKYSDKLTLSENEEIRKLIIDNYLILFYIDEEQKQVNVVAVHNHLRDSNHYYTD